MAHLRPLFLLLLVVVTISNACHGSSQIPKSRIHPKNNNGTTMTSKAKEENVPRNEDKYAKQLTILQGKMPTYFEMTELPALLKELQIGTVEELEEVKTFLKRKGHPQLTEGVLRVQFTSFKKIFNEKKIEITTVEKLLEITKASPAQIKEFENWSKLNDDKFYRDLIKITQKS